MPKKINPLLWVAHPLGVLLASHLVASSTSGVSIGATPRRFLRPIAWYCSWRARVSVLFPTKWSASKPSCGVAGVRLCSENTVGRPTPENGPKRVCFVSFFGPFGAGCCDPIFRCAKHPISRHKSCRLHGVVPTN